MNRVKVCLIAAVFLLVGGKEGYAESNLQQEIDRALEGSTIILQDKIYEGPIKISKSIHLIGKKGTVIQYSGKGPAITIKGEDVQLEDVSVNVKGLTKSQPAIFLSGRGHSISQVNIKTDGIGIKLDYADSIKVEKTTITGNGEDNAIDLWESNDNQFKNNQLKIVQDGFYAENSHGNQFVHNEIEKAHYGLHLMYSDSSVIENNVSQNNFTGAMIMGAEATVIRNNVFADNRENVNSQGLLLYETSDAKISDNQIVNNRIGIFIEEANENQLKQNLIKGNFVGIQFKNASKNQLKNNDFFGNVNESQAINSHQNTFTHNYWDEGTHLDRNQDGISDIAYQADPYFLALTEEVPEYRLFFQAPGMVILQKLLKSPDTKLLIDKEPSMVTNSVQKKAIDHNMIVWLTCSLLLLLSLSLFIKGRKSL